MSQSKSTLSLNVKAPEDKRGASLLKLTAGGGLCALIGGLVTHNVIAPDKRIQFEKMSDEGQHRILSDICLHNPTKIEGFNRALEDIAQQRNISTAALSQELKFPLWSPLHGGGSTLVIKDQRIKSLLDRAVPDLKKTVLMDDVWAHMVALGIMDNATVKRCQVGVLDDQVENTLQYLKRDSVWKVHGFCRALAETEQDAKIDLIFGEDGCKIYSDT